MSWTAGAVELDDQSPGLPEAVELEHATAKAEIDVEARARQAVGVEQREEALLELAAVKGIGRVGRWRRRSASTPRLSRWRPRTVASGTRSVRRMTALPGQPPVANDVDAAVDAMEPAASDPAPDLIGAHPQRRELLAADHPVPPKSEVAERTPEPEPAVLGLCDQTPFCPLDLGSLPHDTTVAEKTVRVARRTCQSCASPRGRAGC